MIILGIETSCDETAAAVIYGRGDKIKVLSNVVSSQIEIHKKYGGVVPEVAAREHILNVLPVVNEALEKAGKFVISTSVSEEKSLKVQSGKYKGFLPRRKVGVEMTCMGIDAIAVTVGPGLITSLLVGAETAKTLAYAWRKPVIAINHIEGHVYANFIDNQPKFPALILTVSGGHTMLILMSGHGKYKVLGETRDDAAGEAFDKAAQLLQLGYPGGPIISQLAARSSQLNKKNSYELRDTSYEINLPRPMLNSKDFDFSFSGLKTALLYEIQKDRNWKKKIPEYAHEFQLAVVDVLVYKTIKAALKYNVKNIMLSGGVAANLELRRKLADAVKEKLPGAVLNIPEFKYCTDNAAMIAAAGYFMASASWRRKKFTPTPAGVWGLTPWQKLKADANLELL